MTDSESCDDSFPLLSVPSPLLSAPIVTPEDVRTVCFWYLDELLERPLIPGLRRQYEMMANTATAPLQPKQVRNTIYTMGPFTRDPAGAQAGFKLGLV